MPGYILPWMRPITPKWTLGAEEGLRAPAWGRPLRGRAPLSPAARCSRWSLRASAVCSPLPPPPPAVLASPPSAAAAAACSGAALPACRSGPRLRRSRLRPARAPSAPLGSLRGSLGLSARRLRPSPRSRRSPRGPRCGGGGSGPPAGSPRRGPRPPAWASGWVALRAAAGSLRGWSPLGCSALPVLPPAPPGSPLAGPLSGRAPSGCAAGAPPAPGALVAPLRSAPLVAPAPGACGAVSWLRPGCALAAR